MPPSHSTSSRLLSIVTGSPLIVSSPTSNSWNASPVSTFPTYVRLNRTYGGLVERRRVLESISWRLVEETSQRLVRQAAEQDPVAKNLSSIVRSMQSPYWFAGRFCFSSRLPPDAHLSWSWINSVGYAQKLHPDRDSIFPWKLRSDKFFEAYADACQDVENLKARLRVSTSTR